MADKNHIAVGGGLWNYLFQYCLHTQELSRHRLTHETEVRYVALWRSPRTYTSQVYEQTKDQRIFIPAIPSLIGYRDENPGLAEPYCWGADVRPGMTMFSWFKLLLNPELNPNSYYDRSLEGAVAMGIMRRPEGRTPNQAVCDFLRKLRGTASAFHSGQRRDVVCICDCGGGTVDVACYEILSAHADIQYTELTAGAGTLCGGTSVDRELYAWMTVTFGKAFTNLPLHKKGEGSAFMRRFHRAKEDLDILRPSDVFHLELEMTLDEPRPEVYDAHRRLVKIPCPTLQKFFTPAVDGICTLLHTHFQIVQEKLGEFAVNVPYPYLSLVPMHMD
ncbi:actin-like ATPase-domain-containing protein [Aspergillus terreus]|uniref:Actin-like ATPase-domain-containing protein n=1 Tax=Aspergillus terreus TaxID=33178 RepID=A0A5M3Z0M2_ASPTE|nr:hypothetical protein ATETN484_0007026200 [Aspergillus terreus]GFF16067.1 actin-like ATPase-domain-containing protein [Aspergillus terreus]